MSETAFLPLVVPRVGDAPIDLRGETDRARSRGYAEGFAEGRRIALAQAEEQRAAEQVRMQQLVDAYLHERGSILSAVRDAHEALEARVAELAALSAERIEALALELAVEILGAELSDPARSAGHAVRRALAEMPRDRWTRVTFSDRDAATLAADPDGAPLLRGVEVGSSPTVDAGGALVEIEDGAVDTRIAQAIARATAALHDADDPMTAAP
ncbi:FliH/SctL family protein [Microbacterium sp. H83]|uniref:FliH/SctL family protein n=1 Tax=Microbacterium sp. H83 TaxID=1827324 RepID=UPI0012F90B68|nr:FliH/SctL family protein [Microbacterium sp. H83]